MVGVGVRVEVGVAVGVFVGVGVGVKVAVGVDVRVGVEVLVGVEVMVGTKLSTPLQACIESMITTSAILVPINCKRRMTTSPGCRKEYVNNAIIYLLQRINHQIGYTNLLFFERSCLARQ